MIDVFVISIANPILVGLYQDNKLIKTFDKEGKTSDVLPTIFDEILKNYEINRIFYVNSPGSYMAIKVSYIFLKTISITENLAFFATNGFYFNNNSPIKALGKKYFINKLDDNNEIVIEFINDNEKLEEFKLPKVLDEKIFSKKTLPIYNLPAV